MAYKLTETVPASMYNIAKERQVSVGVLCDGMGGEGNGGMCAREAVQAFGEAFAETGSFGSQWHLRLRMGLYAANAAVMQFKQAENCAHSNSGTTLIASVISEDNLHFVSVGDSPIYLFQKSERSNEYKATRINDSHAVWYHYFMQDGTMYQQEVSKERAGEINKNASAESYCKTKGLYCAVLGRTIGYLDESGDKRVISLRNGDIVMLCSDGVSNTIDESEMSNIMRNYGAAHHTANEVAYQIMQAVKQNAQPRQDNASCIIFKVRID